MEQLINCISVRVSSTKLDLAGMNMSQSITHRLERPLLRWVEAGKIKQSPLFEMKNRANIRFKYALRFVKNFVKNNVDSMRADSTASKLQNHSYQDFGKKLDA